MLLCARSIAYSRYEIHIIESVTSYHFLTFRCASSLLPVSFCNCQYQGNRNWDHHILDCPPAPRSRRSWASPSVLATPCLNLVYHFVLFFFCSSAPTASFSADVTWAWLINRWGICHPPVTCQNCVENATMAYWRPMWHHLWNKQCGFDSGGGRGFLTSQQFKIIYQGPWHWMSS